MNLNKKNFVKYIIFLGVIYGGMLLVNNGEIQNKRKTFLILVGSLFVMSMIDSSFLNPEKLSNVWDQAKELDNIDLSFDSPAKSNEIVKKAKKLELIKISESEEQEQEEEEETVKDDDIEEEEEAEEQEAVPKKMNLKQIVKTVSEVTKKPVNMEKMRTMIKEELEKNNKVSISKIIKQVEENPKMVQRKSVDIDEKADCSVEVAKIKRRLESELREMKKQLMVTRDRMNESRHAVRYMNMLASTLRKKGIIDKTDVANLNAKLESKLLTRGEIIESLEKLVREGKPRTNVAGKKVMNSMKYSERPGKSYEPIGKGVSKWSNEYTILSTDKWTVPMTRPPVCISNTKCKVCPSATDGYPVGLKDWDSSRKVTNMKINKKWAKDMMDSSKDEMVVEVEN